MTVKRRIEVHSFLYEKCQEDNHLLSDILDDYVNCLSESKLDELEDLLVNNFGDY